MSPTTAVLLMAYGTPRSREEILPYYTDIRRGRPPTPELLDDLTRRYEAIGGLSPLARLTEAQREQIFQIPGIGREFITSAFNRDYTLVLGTVILYAALIMLLNLLVDIAQAWMNPKVRLES